MLFGMAPVAAAALAQSGEAGVTRHYAGDEVQLTLYADQRAIGIADSLRLVLSVEAPAGTAVGFPRIAGQLGPFVVRSQIPIGPFGTGAGRQIWRREFILEPAAAGELAIPKLTVEFRLPSARADAPPGRLGTDDIAVAVTTVLADDVDPTKPRDVAPPVSLEPPGLPAWVWLAAGLVLALGLLATWLWRRWRRYRPGAARPVARPAHVLALEALQRLQGENLIGEQQIERFYVALTDILRRYVVWRFGLRAPAQTTEEFLTAADVSGGLIAARSGLLGNFLRHCDLVKFARHRPTPTDMRQAFDRARAFVEETADERILVAAEAS